MSREGPVATADALARALEQVWSDSRDVHLTPVAESHSGFLYWVDATVDGAATAAVLRLPPPGARPVGAADIARQTRIMTALGATEVPVPRIIAHAAGPELDGRPFVLMEKVVGDPVGTALMTMSREAVLAAAFATIDLVAAVPVADTGIGHEQVADPEEAVRRWQALRERAPQELVGRAPELERRLLSTPAPRGRVRLVHGDFHPGNLIFRDRSVVAVLDWEVAGLGVTAADKADLCLMGIRARFGEAYSGAAYAIPLDAMVAMADEPGFDRVLAAACHKYASILGYNLALHRRGKRVDPAYEGLTATIAGLVDVGLELLS
jgi:aminoglycoside phosphotransferase (APT) family kinase protein